MPELPETETIARDLHAAITGNRIIQADVRRADVLRGVTPAELSERTADAVIERVWRRAKLVVLDLSTEDRIVVQPRFTGALLLDSGEMDERERRYSTLDWLLDDERRLHYRDIRRLGTVSLMTAPEFHAYTSALGVEPLDPAFTAAHLSVLLRDKRQAVKKSLMDQKLVVGAGNIYANEALWRACIDPSRPSLSLLPAEVAALHSALVTVLTEAIAQRGTSFRDYRDASGGSGRFAALLAVYGRGGQPCTRCGRRLVETHAIDGRTSVFCYVCQK